MGGSDDAAVELVANALITFAANNGKSFVRYPTPESGRLHDAVLDKAKSLANREVLQALFKTKLLRFKEAVMDATTEQIFDAYHEASQLNNKDKASWVKTISLRCRIMLS